MFLNADVIAMARAILEDPIEFYSSDYGDEWSCNFCGCSAKEEGGLKHENDCAMLIARDVLTRINDQ